MMNIDHERCYAAIQSRDERFDGRFYTAVLTTGIFCRPICPARTPRPENVRFYPSAAAAAEAGFRPCLRCRPELSPDSIEWNETSTLVARALRLIGEGVLDEGSVGDLAARLHVSPRHLRRLFARELGTSPVAVAQMRRLLFAKKLISETNLPMVEIAFSAGYSSIRRFNDAVQATYGRAPTELRRVSEETFSASDCVELKLFYRPPYDWLMLRRCLAAQAVPGVEAVDERGYRRAVRLGDESGVIAVQPMPEERCVRLSVPIVLSRHLRTVAERVKRIFDLNADPEAIHRHLRSDPLLAARLRQHPGVRLPGAWDPFATAVWTILAQTGAGAAEQCRRLVVAHGERLSDGESELRLFPTPERLADVDCAELGIDAAAALVIQRLSAAVAAGYLLLGTQRSLEDSVVSLQETTGVDSLVAHRIALSALAEPDALPLPSTESEMWRPWRGYAVVLIEGVTSSAALSHRKMVR